MASKPEFVDLIGDATRQRRRQKEPSRALPGPAVEAGSRLSRWPPAMFRQWKLDHLLRWASALGTVRRRD